MTISITLPRIALPAPLSVILSLLIVAVIVDWSPAPQLFTSFDPAVGIPADKLQAPSAAHWFGTDHLGRDLLARAVHGTASSVSSAMIALALGGIVGRLAGFFGGWVDTVLARLVYASALVTVVTVLSLNGISRWLRKTD